MESTRYNLFDLKSGWFRSVVAALRRIEDGSHALTLTPQQAADLSTAKAGVIAPASAAVSDSKIVNAATNSEEELYPCATCSGGGSSASSAAASAAAALFASVHEYRAHCKSAWHRHNMKLKSGNQPPIGEEEFSELAADANGDGDGGDDDSDAASGGDSKTTANAKSKATADGSGGDSGSDAAPSDDDMTTAATGTADAGDASYDNIGGGAHAPRILFYTAGTITGSGGGGGGGGGGGSSKTDKKSAAAIAAAGSGDADKPQVITIWKNVLHSGRPSSLVDYVSLFRSLPDRQSKWFIFISHGGRFAGGVFVGNQCVVHKAISRYTVRKKQGGSQATRDNSGSGVASSMGSQIRRAQTVKFKQDIVDIQNEWSDHLLSAHRIFLYTPSTNRQYFFHSACVINKNDPRVTSIPFAVRRPVFAEVQRVHKWLSTIEVAPSTAAAIAAATNVSDAKSSNPPAAAAAAATKDEKTAAAAAAAAAADASTSDGKAALPPNDQLLHAIRDSDWNGLRRLIDSEYKRPAPSAKYPIYAPIYYAASLGSVAAVRILLGIPPLATPPPATASAAPSIQAPIASTANAAAATATAAPPTTVIATAAAAASTPAHAASNSANSSSGGSGGSGGSGAGAPALLRVYGGVDDPTPEWFNRSALHRAAADGATEIVELLLAAGADPTLTGDKSQTPYQLAASKKCRAAFESFAAANPTRWDYRKANVPVHDESAAKAVADKKKAKKKAAREKEKTKKAEEKRAAGAAAEAEAKAKAADAARAELLRASLDRDLKVSTLSDREKRAQAAELRLLALRGSGAKCDECGKPIVRVPFERLNFRYCTIQCLQTHKTKTEGTTAAAPKHI